MAEAIQRDFTTRDYIRVLFRQKWTIVVTILTVCFSTFIGLKFKTPLYEAEVKMLISAQKQVESPYYREILDGRNVEASITQSEIVTSTPVLQRAIMALNLHTRPLEYEKKFSSPLKARYIDWRVKNLEMDRYPADQQVVIRYRLALEDLKEKIRVEPVRDTNLFKIKVRDYSPIGAAIIANTVSRSYVIFDLEQQLVEILSKYTEKNPAVRQIKDNIQKLEANLSGQPLSNIDALGPATIKIIDQAIPPVKPLGLPEKLTFVLAAVMSLFLGVLLAFVFEYADQSFRAKHDLEDFLGLPVIACVNRKRGFGEGHLIADARKDSQSPRATSYRILAQQMVFLAKTKKLKAIIFGSVGQKESSLILANLATMLATRMQLKTLVVDANLRRPRMHKIFDKPVENGLANALEGHTVTEPLVKSVAANMDLITAGRTSVDPGVLLDAAGFEAFLDNYRKRYDIILVDGADLRDFRDTALLAPALDGVVLVIGEGSVRRQVVEHAVQPLRDNHARLLGAVMNNRNYVIPRFLYESV